MKQLQVELSMLETTATRLDNMAQDYQRLINHLFENVDYLATKWEGEDHSMFNQQIKSYDEQMRRVYALCTQYAEFIRNSCKSYREMQAQLASSVTTY